MSNENLDVIKLKAACDAAIANPAYQPKKTEWGTLETHCNQAVVEIAGKMGVGLPLVCADELCDLFAQKWELVSPENAVQIALFGGVCVAGRKFTGHGHVAVVYPAQMQFSATYQKAVPVLANVGKENRVMRVSEAFREAEAPDYWAAPREVKP